jgi:thiamine pyrophosphate-dependent acetolactate synthase large subunit-like protein
VSRLSGARAICGALEDAGAGVVFGLPGGQNVALFEALRRSSLRTIVPTSELAAGFAAAGFAAASGRPGVLTTIPGPGFAYALPAIAEARLDSLPLVVVAVAPREGGTALPLQAFDQAAVAAPLVKEVLSADVDGTAASVRRALALAVSGEPGPVLVHVSEQALEARDADEPAAITPESTVDAAVVADVAGRLAAAERVVVHVGGGAAGCAADVVALVERVGAVAISTTSGRGVVPEDHPRSLAIDAPGTGASALNALLDAADVVLALGVKYSHNGALGGALRIDPHHFVRVDASAAVLAAAYPADTAVEADVPAFVRALLAELPAEPGRRWPGDEHARLRPRLDRAARTRLEPGLRVTGAEAPRDFFAALRRALPRDGVLVTDSGLHQQLARAHFPVLAPRTLVVPTDLQSMGFGIPAALGVAAARPGAPVVALVGDGGLAVSGLELATAVRERLAPTVVVFSDRRFSLIRLQQLARFGQEFGVDVRPPDVEGLAAALGVGYIRLDADPEGRLRDAIATGEPVLAEVLVDEPRRGGRLRLLGRARRGGRRV